MTGLELLTAAGLGAAPVVCVLRDREYGQIAQFQRASGASARTSALVPYELSAIACAAGCEFLALGDDRAVPSVLAAAFERSRAGKPVVVEVAIDASRPTFFARGVVATNFLRLPWGDRVRKIARFAARKVAGALEPS